MPYRPLHTGESHSETCPQLGYMGYSEDSNRNRLWRLGRTNGTLLVVGFSIDTLRHADAVPIRTFSNRFCGTRSAARWSTRAGKLGSKKIGVQIVPGVIGPKPTGRSGYGEHSFRRYRVTFLRLEGAPQPMIDIWPGHGKKTMSDEYTRLNTETAKRRDWAEKVGLGFYLPVEKIVVKFEKEDAA